ncbi:MAG: winged helix-turn-helix transcriptional regulator [Parcubacteria group bacterium]
MKPQTVKCPITKVAELLSDTWTMLIMHFLMDKPKRFSDLEKSLTGISTRTLTLKLKKLLLEKMIIKNKDGYYEVTKKGKGLKIIENSMIRYDKKYL